MRFPNAQAGVKKLYTAQLLELIAVACGLIGAIGLAAGSATLLLIFSIIAAVLSIIAFILEIVGLGQAQKDDNLFRMAFFCVIAGIVFTVIGVIVAGSPVVSAILTLLGAIASFLIIFFVIKGIQSVAEKLGDSALVAKAKRLFMIIVITYIASFVINFVATLLKANPAVITVAGILAIIAAIVEIISIFLYIGLLKHAKESFLA